MELNQDLIVPGFEDLDENVYQTLVKQVETQRSTINLLHLQLKKQGTVATDQLLEEKDRLILSLQSKLDEVKVGGGALGVQNDTEELREENFQLEQLLKEKNREIREIKNRYNDHLNDLNDQIQTGNEAPIQSPQEQQELATSKARLNILENELKVAKQQIEFHKNQAELNHSLDQESVSLELHNQVQQLQQQLQSRDQEIQNLNERIALNETSLPATENEELQGLKTTNLELQKRISELESGAGNIADHSDRGIDWTVNELSSFIKTYDQVLALETKLPEDKNLIQLKEGISQLLSHCGLRPFESIGEQFQESRHHAVEIAYSTEHQHDLVLKVLQTGFTYQGEVFQKANVVVSKNPVHCHKCGFESKLKSNFCSNCGVKLQLELSESDEPVFLDNEENSKAYLDLGASYFQRRELAQSLDAFEKALRLDPNSTEAIIGSSKVQELLGNYGSALTILEKLDHFPHMESRQKAAVDRIEAKMRIIATLQDIR